MASQTRAERLAAARERAEKALAPVIEEADAAQNDPNYSLDPDSVVMPAEWLGSGVQIDPNEIPAASNPEASSDN